MMELVLMSFEFLDDRILDGKVARVVNLFTFLVFHGSSFVGRILVIIYHVFQRLGNV